MGSLMGRRPAEFPRAEKPYFHYSFKERDFINYLQTAYENKTHPMKFARDLPHIAGGGIVHFLCVRLDEKRLVECFKEAASITAIKRLLRNPHFKTWVYRWLAELPALYRPSYEAVGFLSEKEHLAKRQVFPWRHLNANVTAEPEGYRDKNPNERSISGPPIPPCLRKKDRTCTEKPADDTDSRKT